jgi:flagellar export protein FliJ
MKSRDTMIRLKRFQVDERRRQVGQIEAMVAEFMRIAADLDREIEVEEQRAGIGDVNHFAYPTYARAAAQRRDNLLRSAEELKVQLAEAHAAMEDAQADLEKAEALDARDQRTEAGRETASRRAS